MTRPPASPWFTYRALMAASTATLAGFGFLFAGIGRDGLAVVCLVAWGGVAAVCGFRPLWDDDFRTEGGRLAHSWWFFTRTCGLKGLAATALPIVAVLLFVTHRSGNSVWAAVNAFAVVIAVGVIAWRPAAADLKRVAFGVLAGLFWVAAPFLGYFTAYFWIYFGLPLLGFYLLGVLVSWLRPAPSPGVDVETS
ncbi:MAG: hypothetical protein QM658_06245 [Gordonia sp. (in: high G+C Gram-positive bacteria)]